MLDQAPQNKMLTRKLRYKGEHEEERYATALWGQVVKFPFGEAVEVPAALAEGLLQQSHLFEEVI